MALNRSDKSRILRRYFPGMTRNSEMSTEPSLRVTAFRTATNASVGVVLALVLGQRSSLWRLGPFLVPRPLVPAVPW